MSILDRWKMAYQSPLGMLLILLVFFLCLLLIIYAALRVTQRKRDLLKYLFNSYYEKAEKISNYQFVSKSKASFFGRQTIVKIQEGFGVCQIPPPDLAFEQVREKFAQFYRLIHCFSNSCFASYSWVHTEQSLICVQKDLVQNNGHLLLNICHYLMDGLLSEIEKEKILLFLATDLSLLHKLRTDSGERIYHGFIIPRSIFLKVDTPHLVDKIIVADLGFAFSIQSELLFYRLEALQRGLLPIEKYEAHEIIEQFSMLAPEQKDPMRFHEVGPCSDFYSYGALAIYLFTAKKFSRPEDVDWTIVPVKWHSFLKSCLSDVTEKRPKDFLEIKDWLSNPELALTSQKGIENLQSIEDVEEFHADSLSDLLQKMRSHLVKAPSNEQEKQLKKLLDFGIKATRLSKWNDAKKHFQQLLDLHPRYAEAHIHFAILYYELGDLKNAEKHYKIAKELNPHLSKTFREHIAFNL